jgi:hypothetical protein
VQSGHFSIQDGSFVTAAAKPPLRNVTANLTDDDLIIEGFACIGESCTSGDDDFPVLRLKGQNPNILFDDVEPLSLVSSSFNDWAIGINASDVAKFSILDVDGELTPFSILGGAPDNSLFIRDNGNVGIGTATPAAKLEVGGGEVRLPSGSGLGGFTHFNYSGDGKNYIRGITVLADNGGWVGIGTASPVTKLHVSGSSVPTTAPTKILVQETSSTTTPRELLELQNKGAAVLILEDTTVPERWGIGTFGASLAFDNQATTGLEMTLGPTGNLTIAGTLTQGSDRATKTGIMPVQPEEVLEKLVSLPISTWSRKDEDPKVRHLGPMAQDFSAIFGLGEDNRHIAPLDMAGVSMASIQALHERMTQGMAEKDAEIAALRQRLVVLEELMSKLAAEGEPAP